MSNPFNPTKQTMAHSAWREGYATHRSEVANLRAQQIKEIGYAHPECDDCTDVIIRQTNVKVMFQLMYTGLEPTSTDIVHGLREALPEEWWADHVQADWGLIALFPLNDAGITVDEQ